MTARWRRLELALAVLNDPTAPPATRVLARMLFELLERGAPS